MTIIAEGVETFEEVAYLQAATQIRYAQGYYFAKPMLLEQMEWLDDRPGSREDGFRQAATTRAHAGRRGA